MLSASFQAEDIELVLYELLRKACSFCGRIGAMTIEETRAKKHETEQAIRSLLTDFCETTGLLVEAVQIDAAEMRAFARNDKVATLISNVRLHVRL